MSADNKQTIRKGNRNWLLRRMPQAWAKSTTGTSRRRTGYPSVEGMGGGQVNCTSRTSARFSIAQESPPSACRPYFEAQ